MSRTDLYDPDMGCNPRRLHLRMPLASLLLYSHHLRQPQEVQVHIPFWISCHTIRPSVAASRQPDEPPRTRDNILGRCSTDVEV